MALIKSELNTGSMKSKFFKNGMHCLYLDQFAASHICDSPPNEIWTKISSLVKEGVEKRRLICPLSVEHMIETSGKKLETARIHDEEFRKLSFGWSFYPEAEITSRLIICKIRGIKTSKNDFMRKKETVPLCNLEIHSDLKNLKYTFSEMIDDASAPVNQIREACRNGRKGSSAVRNTLIQIIKGKQNQHLVDRFETLAILGRLQPTPMSLAGHMIPFWADKIFSILVQKHKLTQWEASLGASILRKEGIDAIPTLSIRASLEAMLAHKNVQETPNDQIDIMRISVALPFADMVLTDGPRVHELKELKLDKKFQTSVFSGKNPDLQKFTQHLSKIVNG